MKEIEHAAVNQTKIAGIQRNVVVAQPSDDPIENPSCKMKGKRFRPSPPHPVHHLESSFPKFYEIENDLGWVLQVAVDLDCGVPLS